MPSVFVMRGPSTPVAGLRLQLRADDLGYADGAFIMSWVDAISGYTFTPGDSSVAPIVKTGIANGHKVSRWASGKQLFRAGSIPAAIAVSSYTHVMVLAPTTAGSRYVYGMNAGVGPVAARIDTGFVTGAIDGAGGAVTGSTAVASTGAFSIVTTVRDVTTGTLAMFVNGVSAGSSATSGAITYGSGFSVGDDQRSYPTHSFVGDLAELRMYDAAMSGADRYAMEQALGVTYGISV